MGPIPVFIIAGVSLARAVHATAYNWTECKENVKQIRDGTLKIGSITHDNLDQYLYHGTVTGLTNLSKLTDPDYVRITYAGCKALCGDPVATSDTPDAMSSVANWIFPLAVLLNLPYESPHENKISKTAVALLNWLGSPQTALTATIFNFRQIREAYRRVYKNRKITEKELYSAAYFVLCSVNQFDELQLVDSEGKPRRMLKLLMYGLLRPLSDEKEADVELTKKLLGMMTFKLRMLRRRGVIPMFANLVVFFLAFVFSVILTFAEIGGSTNSFSFSLAFGLLMTWLPLLVVFSIVDRNPVSAERSAELLSRWLYNVAAIETWVDAPRGDSLPDPIKWWDLDTEMPNDLTIGEFIGQGRKIQYCGLPQAFIDASGRQPERGNFGALKRDDLRRYANETAKELRGWSSATWYKVAALSLFIVWCAIMSAFVISFISPTVGLGCRTLMYLLFGGLSSVSWLIQFSKHPPEWAVWISYVSNFLAVLSLLAVVVFQVTGLASNSCFCKTSTLNFPILGGYMDFESIEFYRDNFNVVRYWTAAAVVGGVVPGLVFCVAFVWWVRCRDLWKANESHKPKKPSGTKADTRWLQ